MAGGSLNPGEQSPRASRGAARARLGDGRLHFQHGPIDLVIRCWGEAHEVAAAGEQAWGRFRTILEELVAELPTLRTPLAAAHPLARGLVARRMVAATWPHRARFITPMAAVAGAVADEVLAALLSERHLTKAYVNNGGDIAVHVLPGQSLEAGIVMDPAYPTLDAGVRLDASCGIATSGWRGRSQSLGIADAVTVIGPCAAQADAAATLVANAVNVDHAAIRRRPARELREDSDLGTLPVTTEVGELPPEAIAAALDCGLTAASTMQRSGLLQSACLALQGKIRLLPAVLALWAIAGLAQAAQVEMFYLSTPDCRFCRAWEANSKSALLDSREGRLIRFVEVRGETLRKPILLEHYPTPDRWAFEQIGPSRGVPRFVLFVNGKLTLSVYGTNAYEREFLPALRNLFLRDATTALNREQGH